MLFKALLRFRNERNIIEPFRMNRTMEYGLLEIDRMRVLLGNFWPEILRSRRHSSSS